MAGSVRFTTKVASHAVDIPIPGAARLVDLPVTIVVELIAADLWPRRQGPDAEELSVDAAQGATAAETYVRAAGCSAAWIVFIDHAVAVVVESVAHFRARDAARHIAFGFRNVAGAETPIGLVEVLVVALFAFAVNDSITAHGSPTVVQAVVILLGVSVVALLRPFDGTITAVGRDECP
jgi:hypothetical protein